MTQTQKIKRAWFKSKALPGCTYSMDVHIHDLRGKTVYLDPVWKHSLKILQTWLCGQDAMFHCTAHDGHKYSVYLWL